MEMLCLSNKNNLQPHNSQQVTTGIVFIDPTVDDYQSLMAAVMPKLTVFLLDSNRDGVEQISDILSDWSDLSSLHIVSHGAPGIIQLGAGSLSLETIDQYSHQLQGWANALKENMG
jgi:Domain of unknown function (DUF4347)